MKNPSRFSTLNSKFDIIGDVHGCLDELDELFIKLEYALKEGIYLCDGRIPVFCGDLTDRGPSSVGVCNIIFKMVKSKKALYIPGNHCNKLYRLLCGSKVKIANGLETTVAELDNLGKVDRVNFAGNFIEMYENSSFYLILDNGNLVVSHAGIKEDMIGKMDEKVKTQCIYGDVTGEKDEHGFPIRLKWYDDYRGEAINVYGHTPEFESKFINKTINIDQGSVFGWKLAALRYPELSIVSVDSHMPKSEEQFKRMQKLEESRLS
jgi:protein phosphatase